MPFEKKNLDGSIRYISQSFAFYKNVCLTRDEKTGRMKVFISDDRQSHRLPDGTYDNRNKKTVFLWLDEAARLRETLQNIEEWSEKISESLRSGMKRKQTEDGNCAPLKKRKLTEYQNLMQIPPSPPEVEMYTAEKVASKPTPSASLYRQIPAPSTSSYLPIPVPSTPSYQQIPVVSTTVQNNNSEMIQPFQDDMLYDWENVEPSWDQTQNFDVSDYIM